MNNNIYLQKASPAEEIDKYFLGFIVAFVILIPTLVYSSIKNTSTKIFLTYIIIGGLTTSSVFTSGWDTSRVVVDDLQYSSGVSGTVKAEMKILIGLRGFNVTMYGVPKFQLNNDIQYNEYFSWSDPEWRHRVLVESLEEAIFRGTPGPILSVAEAMAVDAEYIRWGREYRVAGYYTWIFMWLGFSFGTLSFFVYSVIGNSVLSGFLQLFNGASLILSIILWVSIKPYTFIVPFSSSAVISPRPGYSFYLDIAAAVLACTHGSLVVNYLK